MKVCNFSTFKSFMKLVYIYLFRLLPYFRGDHHLEEIMYYENLHRSELMALLDKFRSVLITCQYEDPATSFTHMDHHQKT